MQIILNVAQLKGNLELELSPAFDITKEVETLEADISCV